MCVNKEKIMGFLSGLKELFNKNIECDGDLFNHIVYFYKKKRRLYLNKNIIVRENCCCVVVFKGRVCDTIFAGKYKINEQSIPETYSRAKINKRAKKGKKIKRIRADLYFLNLKEFKNFEFESDEPFFIKSKDLGRIRGYLKGTCTVKAIDPARLIKCLINETGREKTENVKKDIGLWIGNKINKCVEKTKIPIENILSNTNYVSSILNAELENGYDKIGIFVTNINLKAIDFPKKYQKKVNEYMIAHNKTKIRPNVNLGASTPNGNTRKQFVNISSLNNPSGQGAYKQCGHCGFKNPMSNIMCSNCGNRLV